MKRLVAFLLLMTPLASQSQEFSTFTAAWWNVENLFDTRDDPKTNDDEFTPQGDRHWTRRRLSNKVNGIYKTLLMMNLPDVVGLAEVENNYVLRELCQRLIDRRLFRIEMSQDPFDPAYKDEILHRIAKFYGVSMFDASFMLLQGVSSNHAYHPGKPAINILYKDGTVRDISEVSAELHLDVLTQPTVRHFICYPKELQGQR